MHRRVDAHRFLVGVFTCDLFVNLKKISVAFANCIFTQAFNGVRKVKVDTQTAGPDSPALVADFFGRS